MCKFIYNAFLKIFHIFGNFKKKCGHLDLLYVKVGARVGVKVATFHTGLLPCHKLNGTIINVIRLPVPGSSVSFVSFKDKLQLFVFVNACFICNRAFNLHIQYMFKDQCFGSVSFWCGSASGIMDPDPVLDPDPT